MPGKLFIVGTPIGNLEDITLRALRALREADIIAAEDTRRTAQLLARHGIVGREGPHAVVGPRCVAANTDTQQRVPTSRRLVSYHEFNEAKRTQELLKELQQGRTVALVTDAGMPTISDPGQRLIQAVLEWNAGCSGASKDSALHRSAATTTENREPRTENSIIPLEIIPGPSAVTMAVAASGGLRGTGGSPVRRSFGHGAFLFFGFLPHKSGQRRKALTLLAPLPYTLVFFESPYRLVKSLRDMHELLGNRHAVVARELTKKFEEIMRGDLAAILKKLENRSIKGEITVVVDGNEQ